MKQQREEQQSDKFGRISAVSDDELLAVVTVNILSFMMSVSSDRRNVSLNKNTLLIFSVVLSLEEHLKFFSYKVINHNLQQTSDKVAKRGSHKKPV